MAKMSFDSQAESFDSRTGLTEEVCHNVVRAIETFPFLNSQTAILEMGAGTGEIGLHLSALPHPYLGMDLSLPMLKIFKNRFVHEVDPNSRLIHADGNQPWPVRDHSIQIFFSSRTLHLLSLPHVVKEFFRVSCKQGSLLLMGSIKREKSSVKTQMRRQMQKLLKEEGIEGRSGKHYRSELLTACCAEGAEAIEPHTVGHWEVSQTPQDSLDSWASKPGLAGIDVPLELKDRVLKQLESWALDHFGDLTLGQTSTEKYRLEGIWLPTRKEEN